VLSDEEKLKRGDDERRSLRNYDSGIKEFSERRVTGPVSSEDLAYVIENAPASKETGILIAKLKMGIRTGIQTTGRIIYERGGWKMEVIVDDPSRILEDGSPLSIGIDGVKAGINGKISKGRKILELLAQQVGRAKEGDKMIRYLNNVTVKIPGDNHYKSFYGASQRIKSFSKGPLRKLLREGYLIEPAGFLMGHRLVLEGCEFGFSYPGLRGRAMLSTEKSHEGEKTYHLVLTRIPGDEEIKEFDGYEKIFEEIKGRK